MNNSNSINVLKVVATLMVYFCHSTIVYNETYFLTKSDYPWLNLFDTPAWGGVWIFLVIGGCLAAYGFMGVVNIVLKIKELKCMLGIG